MKRIAIYISLLSLAFMPQGKASATLEFEGSPDANPNHFVWSVMDQLDAPDDPDCATIVSDLLDADGTIPEESHDEITNGACNGIASMKTSMQSGMEGGGDSVETNLFDAPDWHAVENLYFEHSTNGTPDGRIAFTVPIDFMSYEFLTFMTSFGQNMDASQGHIALDADVVGGFAEYGAALTMYNVPEFENPEILVNGTEDDEGVVSNLSYDKENNTITFRAAHFSEFDVVEGDEDPDVDTVKVKKYFSPSAGKWRIKMIVKGSDFGDDAKVTVNRRNAINVKHKSSHKMIAYFSLDKLQKIGRDELTIRIVNGDKTEKFGEKLKLSQLDLAYQEIK